MWEAPVTDTWAWFWMWQVFLNRFCFDNPWFWFWFNKSPGKLITSKCTHKWKKIIDSVMSHLFWGNQKLKWFWNQVTRNTSHLNWLPGDRKLRKDRRNREAWTHTISTSLFILNFDVCSLSQDNHGNDSLNSASWRWVCSWRSKFLHQSLAWTL